MAEKSTMTWKAHRSKKYIFMQEGCQVEVKQDSAKQMTFMELNIGEHPARVSSFHARVGKNWGFGVQGGLCSILIGRRKKEWPLIG